MISFFLQLAGTLDTLNKAAAALKTIAGFFTIIFNSFSAITGFLSSLGLSNTLIYLILGGSGLLVFFFLFRFLVMITKLLIIGLIILIILGLVGVLF